MPRSARTTARTVAPETRWKKSAYSGRATTSAAARKASVVDAPARYLGFLALYDALFVLVCWASFEYVVAE